MTRATVWIIVGFWAYAAGAQEPSAKTVTMLQNWKPGESRKYVLVMEKAPRETTHSLLEIKVLRERGDGHELQWGYLDSRLADGRPLNSATEALFKLVKAVPLRLETGEDGGFIQIINDADTQKLNEGLIDGVLKEYPPDKRPGLRAAMTQVMRDGSLLSPREPESFFAAYGVDFRADKVIKGETDISYLNASIPAVMHLECKPAGSDRYTLTIRVVAEGEKAALAFEEQVRAISRKIGGKPLPEGRLVEAMNYTEQCVTTMKEGDSWPEKVECSRNTMFKTQGQETSRSERMLFLPESTWPRK